MGDSPFDRFATAAIGRPDLFPAARARLGWMEFKRLFSSLVSEGLWGPAAPTLAAWQQSRLPKARLQALQRSLPPELATRYDALPETLALPDAFHWLEQCHDVLRAEIHQAVSVTPVTLVARHEPGPLPAGFGRQSAVHRLLAALAAPPTAIAGTLVHGSLADGLVCEGFSDADVLCVVKSPQAAGATFWEAAQWLYQLNHHLFAINPCMHHGPMLAFADELTCASEANLPSVILSHGVWCSGRTEEFAYYESRLENVSAVAGFEFYFEHCHLFVPQLRHAFDALWWTSNTLLLPLLLWQVTEGRSIYKREFYEGPPAGWPMELRSTLERVSAIRHRLGAWITARLPAEPDLSDRGPVTVIEEHRHLLPLASADLRELGLTDAVMAEVRHLWEYVRQTTLQVAAKDCLTLPPAPVVWRWTKPVIRLPHLLALADYAKARESFVARCANKPEVKAVFEFGNVGCPGLSDLDFCVVLDDAYQGRPDDLLATAFTEETAYIMDHDPLFVSHSRVAQLGEFFPIFTSRQLFGEKLSLPPTQEFPAEYQAATITAKNLSKYPRDLDWLLAQPALNLRSVLGLLHSAGHVRDCLGRLGLPIPPSVDRALALDSKIRARFPRDQSFSPEEIIEAVDACVAFCRPVQESLVDYWLSRAKTTSSARRAALTRTDLRTVAWLQRELSQPLQKRTTQDEGANLYPLLAGYLEAKHRFSKFEEDRTRPVNQYIDSLEPGDAGEQESLRNERNLLRAQLADLQHNFAATEKDRLARGEIIESQGRKLTELEGQFDSRLKELKQLYVSAESLKNERNLLQAQLTDLQQNFAATEKDRLARGEIIESQGRKLTELEGQFDSRLKELKQLYVSAESLKNERNLLQAQFTDLQQNFAATEKDRLARGEIIESQGRLYAAAESVKNERNLLRAQLADLQNNFSGAEADRIERGKVIEQQGARVAELEKLVWLTEQNRDHWKAVAEAKSNPSPPHAS